MAPASPTNSEEWAWPRLIDSLQRDLVRLQSLVESMREETIHTREAHRAELSGLIEQMRLIRAQLDPILQDRIDAKVARQKVFWGWVEKVGWAVIVMVAFLAANYLRIHRDE